MYLGAREELSMEQLGIIRHPGPADSGKGSLARIPKNCFADFFGLSSGSGEATEALAGCIA